MSKFAEQQTALSEQKIDRKENERSSRETLGKYYYDLSKLAFATTVVNAFSFIYSGVVTSDKITSLAVGVVITLLFAILGYRTIKIRKL